MNRKPIRLTIVEPPEAPEKKLGKVREKMDTVLRLLAGSGANLQVCTWGDSGYSRILLRLRRICPEEIARADLALFLFPDAGDSLLDAEYAAAQNCGSSGNGPVCVKGSFSADETNRSLLEMLAKLDPSLPVRLEENGRVLVGGTEVLAGKPVFDLHNWLHDDISADRCPRCGGRLERYDDWYICEQCHSIN